MVELLGQMCPNVCPDFQRIVGCRAGCSKRKSFRFGHPGTEQIQQLHRLEKHSSAPVPVRSDGGSASQNAWVQGVPDRAMQPFFAAIFRLTLRVSSLIPREEQTAARLSLAALASTAIKMPPRFLCTGTSGEGNCRRAGRSPAPVPYRMYLAAAGPSTGPTDRKILQSGAVRRTQGWIAAPGLFPARKSGRFAPPAYCCSSDSRQIFGSINILSTWCFHDLFLLDQTGGLSGHADRRGSLLPSVMFWSDQGCAQLAAGRQGRRRPESHCRSHCCRPEWLRHLCSGSPSCASIHHRPNRKNRTGQSSSRSAILHRRRTWAQTQFLPAVPIPWRGTRRQRQNTHRSAPLKTPWQ